MYTYFRQKWTDGRLAGKLNRTLIIKGGDIENIWVPDPYCYNARESNMMMPDEETHSSVTVQPSGDVLYSKGWVHTLINPSTSKISLVFLLTVCHTTLMMLVGSRSGIRSTTYPLIDVCLYSHRLFV